jgi:hypothetical protein
LKTKKQVDAVFRPAPQYTQVAEMSTMSVGVDEIVFKLLQKFAPEKGAEVAELLLQEEKAGPDDDADVLDAFGGGGSSDDEAVFSATRSSSRLTQSTTAFRLSPVTAQSLDSSRRRKASWSWVCRRRARLAARQETAISAGDDLTWRLCSVAAMDTRVSVMCLT